MKEFTTLQPNVSLFLVQVKTMQSITQNADELDDKFGENYKNVVQNALQSFHWTNRQLTIHLFDAYYKVGEGKIVHKSFCYLSD